LEIGSISILRWPGYNNESTVLDIAVSSEFKHIELFTSNTICGGSQLSQAMGWTTKESGYDSQYGQDIFLFSMMSKPVLGPTQPLKQWTVADVSLKVKQQEREADHSPPSSGNVKNGGAITSFPQASSWHGASLIKPWDNFTTCGGQLQPCL
jgi:hypothetical protein